MKQLLKDTVAQLDYSLYRNGIKHSEIKVHTIEETITELANTNRSMVRFGDGEISMIRGRSLKLQKTTPEIIEDLKRILGYQYEDLIVTIPDIFNDLSIYRKESRQFWKEHLLFNRKMYEKYCNVEREYYNTSFSRFYLTLQNKEKCEQWIEDIRNIWKDKEIVVIEGERTHNGVGNSLLSKAKSVERIIGPASNAYTKVDEILAYCQKYKQNKMFLISLGAAAKPLTEQLFLKGYRALDIGNLDLEYEWFLHGLTQKEKLTKHECISIEENRKAGYSEYLDQIVVRINA